MRQQITTTEEKVALDKELMAQKLVQAEREAQASLREQRAVHKEDLQRLQREKVQAAGLGQAVGWGRALNHCLCLLCDLRRVSFSLCIREMELHLCFRGSGGSWEDPSGTTPYQTCRFPGPNLVQPW